MSYDLLPAMPCWPNPFLPLSEPQPRQYPAPFPMAPTTAAIWAIVSSRVAELWHLGTYPPADPLADVRRELQAFLDEHCEPPTSTESPWIALMRASGCEERQRAAETLELWRP